MAKMQPAVMNVHYYTEATDNWIDIAQGLSIINRRFYRQGMQYALSGITVQFNSNTEVVNGNIRVETLPTSWVFSNAWHKFFAAWKRQQDIALEENESVRAVFNDFKIFMDKSHADSFADGTQNLNDTNMIPRFGDTSVAANQFLTGEWQPSQIVIPNTTPDASGSDVDPTEYYLHGVGYLGGASEASRGIIAGYSYSRALPQSPDPVIDPYVNSEFNILRAMFDTGNSDEEVLENASATNNELPYDQDDYPHSGNNGNGLQLHSEHKLTGTNIGNRLRIDGLVVPCGLLKVTNDTGTGAKVTLHMVPGKYRGYLAEPMQDM